jgi:hypothetical protein
MTYHFDYFHSTTVVVAQKQQPYDEHISLQYILMTLLFHYRLKHIDRSSSTQVGGARYARTPRDLKSSAS